MTIAAHILYSSDPDKNYLLNCLQLIAQQQPQVRLYIFAENITALNISEKNISLFPIQPAIKNKLSLLYWYQFKLPAFLKKHHPSIFISEIGMLSKSSFTKQYLVIRPQHITLPLAPKITNLPYKYFSLFNKQINKAEALFFTEPYLPYLLKNGEAKAIIMHHGLHKSYQPITWAQKEDWINAHTNGADFFVFHVSESSKAHVMPMLKAFSIFKKWQESAMKLVLLLHTPYAETDLEKFHLYKYKADVQWVKFENHPQAAPLYAAAFMHIYLPQKTCDELFGLYSLRVQVPLLVTDHPHQKKIYQNAAAYCQPNEKSISENLLRYYKSEIEKNKIIQQGAPLLADYHWPQAAQKIWAEISL